MIVRVPTSKLRSALGAILAGWVGLWATTAPAQERGLDEGFRAGVDEFQIRLIDFTDFYFGAIAEAADEILAVDPDATTRRNVLVWRVRAASTHLNAIFQDNPVKALVDTWSFCVQMRRFFESGEGRELFGPSQSIAVRAASRLESQAFGFAAAVSADATQADRAQRIIGKWAAQHPLESLSFVRSSSVLQLVEEIEEQRGGRFARIGDLPIQIEGMAVHIFAYVNHMPSILRWELELFLEDALRDRRGIGGALGDLSAMQQSAARFEVIAEALPERAVAEVARLVETESSRFEALAAATVDLLFWRAVQLVGVVFVAAAALLVLWRRLDPRA